MGYHLIGIGGIGMSALARVLLQRGEKVSGSDQKESALLALLRQEGAEVSVGHEPQAIRPEDTIVYSSGIQEENVELQKAKALRLPLLHRSQMLHQLMAQQKPLLVTGSHGKTTTTALLASVLLEANLDPSFVVGGILQRSKTNGRSGKGPYFVAEADESDGSFLRTPAFGAIVTNLDREHMNYWNSQEELTQAFRTFFQQVEDPAHLFWCADDPALRALSPPGRSYGLAHSADFWIHNPVQTERGVCFDLNGDRAIEVALFGKHNALNAAAVFALARSLGIDEGLIRSAFASFGGTQRRLEPIGTVQNIAIYDDYGHHPTEIAATLQALRTRFRERRLVLVFQPHRVSRLMDLFDQFLTCFEGADELLITDVYHAGEDPVEGMDAPHLVSRIGKARYLPRAGLEDVVAPLLQVGDVVLTLGAGDITQVGALLLKNLENVYTTRSLRSLENTEFTERGSL